MTAAAKLKPELFGAVVKIARKQRLVIRGVMHEVRRRVDNSRFVVDAIEGGESATRDFNWLDEGWLAGDIVILPTRWDELHPAAKAMLELEMDAATPEMRRIAYYRQPYAEAFDDHRNGRCERGKCLSEIFQSIADRRNACRAPADYEKPPKRTPLYEFTARYVDADRDIRALLPNHPGRGNRVPRVNAILSDILDELIEAYFLTPVARTKAAMFVAAKRHVQTLNDEVGTSGAELIDTIPLPTRSMVEKRCDKLELFDRDYYRKDPIKAENAHLPVGIGPVATRVNQRWELDSSPLDILIVDEETGALLGRPTITAVIDCATRLIVGWWISFEGESTLQVMQALRHAIAPKASIPGIKNRNPARGKPQGVWVDNGKAHRSNALVEASRRLGFEPFWLPPRRPRLRGKIERWFRTLGVSLIHNLQGTVKSNPKAREHYDAERDAIFTLSEITWLVSYWICDVYNVREHRATKRSPIGLWHELATEHPPSLPSAVADLDVLLSRIEIRKITRKGIEWQGLLFNSPLLAVMRNRPDFDPSQVQVRVNEDDIGCLHVLGPGMSRYEPIPCTNQAYAAGKTLHRHLCSVRHAKLKAEDDRRLTEGDFELAWGEIVLAGKKALLGNGRRKTLKRLGRIFALGVKPADARPPASIRVEGVFDDEGDDVGAAALAPPPVVFTPALAPIPPTPERAPERRALPKPKSISKPKPAPEAARAVQVASTPLREPAPATIEMEADYD